MIIDELEKTPNQLRKVDIISQALNELWITQKTVLTEWQSNSKKVAKEIGVLIKMENILNT